MTTNGIRIIFGGACFVESTVEEVDSWLNVLERTSIKNIDTAELYGQSQFLLGKTGAPSRFTIDTKVPGGFGGDLSTAEAVFKSGKRSLELLGADKASKYPSIFFQYRCLNVRRTDIYKIALERNHERSRQTL
ncbi:hypothetical protein ACKVWL_011418 [Pyricularia oryzae]